MSDATVSNGFMFKTLKKTSWEAVAIMGSIVSFQKAQNSFDTPKFLGVSVGPDDNFLGFSLAGSVHSNALSRQTLSLFFRVNLI